MTLGAAPASTILAAANADRAPNDQDGRSAYQLQGSWTANTTAARPTNIYYTAPNTADYLTLVAFDVSCPNNVLFIGQIRVGGTGQTHFAVAHNDQSGANNPPNQFRNTLVAVSFNAVTAGTIIDATVVTLSSTATVNSTRMTVLQVSA